MGKFPGWGQVGESLGPGIREVELYSKVPVTCQWTAPAAPCYSGARDWGPSPSALRLASRTCGHVKSARGKEGESAGFSFETRLPRAATPTPGLSHRPRPSGLRRKKGGDGTHGGEVGWRERRGRTPRPGRSELEPAQAHRRPPQPGGSGPASPPAARRPRAPAHLARAPQRSRSRTRPREKRARAPSLPAGPSARSLGFCRRCRQALTRCLRRRSPPRHPRRSEVCSARPPLSPPHPLELSLFSRRNRGPALRPSSSAHSPLITPSTHPGPSAACAAARPDVRWPPRCRTEKRRIAAHSPGARPCVRPAAGRRRRGGDGGGWEEARAGAVEAVPGARRRSSWAAPGRAPRSHARGGAGRNGAGGACNPRPPLGSFPEKVAAAAKRGPARPGCASAENPGALALPV